MKKDSNLKLVATCTAGTEKLVSNEITNQGGFVSGSFKGVVNWQGDLEAAYKMCLWSRFSSRILYELKVFKAENEDELYDQVKQVDWPEHMGVETSFAIDCNLASGASITHSKFAALRTKDAIVDFFREKTGERPSVQVERPDIRLNIHVSKNDSVTLSLDLSGESLHKRGYRADGVVAPLKENLAAAIVALSGWSGETNTDCLIDPMCGSGTLLIEAALMFGDSAPGLSRSYFGFMGWKGHDKEVWTDLVDRAIDLEDKGLERDWPVILGYDADPRAVASARKNLKKAGLEDKIHINQGSINQLKRPEKDGLILCNPPYGERLSEHLEVKQLYKGMGRIFSTEFADWQIAMFISNAEMAAEIGIQWERKYRLYNGSIPCRLLVGKSTGGAEQLDEDPAEDFEWSLSGKEVEGDGLPLANRLKKNWKKLSKWVRKESIQCFRVYDRDLPEFNVSIDFYGKWVHVQEYAPPKTIDTELAKKRFNTALYVVRQVFDVNRERVFIKTRKRQKGKGQYQKAGGQKKMRVVREGEVYFLVNFTDYLDTGLFLDHRPVRQQIGETCKGLRFLNLFGYTGSATVHAGFGEAQSTTTVDLSGNYLDWAKMNMALNGLDGPNHKFIKADVMKWLEEERGKYDIIFVDPPTFSNTKKERRVFDVQRDHGRLIKGAMNLLTENGLLIFSTNYKRFALDKVIDKTYKVKDVSDRTIPVDFKRNDKIHKCWELRHG